ncbi:hypothetical protein RSOL_313570, partial [Rhizoctonia solani AG-3 Rhs1AP]
MLAAGRRHGRRATKHDTTPNDEPAPGPTRADTFNPEEVINLAQEEFDEYGAELEPGARVWKTYVREADKFDLDQVDGWNSSLDVTLIFAALFTAICTAFVIESSKSLKEDQAEISARRLDQIAGILFVVANISNPLQPNPANSIAPITPKPFSPRPVDPSSPCSPKNGAIASCLVVLAIHGHK